MLTRTKIEKQISEYQAKMTEALGLANMFRGAVEALQMVLVSMEDEDDAENGQNAADDGRSRPGNAA